MTVAGDSWRTKGSPWSICFAKLFSTLCGSSKNPAVAGFFDDRGRTRTCNQLIKSLGPTCPSRTYGGIQSIYPHSRGINVHIVHIHHRSPYILHRMDTCGEARKGDFRSIETKDNFPIWKFLSHRFHIVHQIQAFMVLLIQRFRVQSQAGESATRKPRLLIPLSG